MGIDKSEVSRATLRRVGAHVENQIEAAEAEVAKEQGAAAALKAQAAYLQQIIAGADKALNEPNSPDHIPDLETLKLVKTWLLKAVHATESASISAKNRAFVAQGTLLQCKGIHDWLQKQVQIEEARITEAANVRLMLKTLQEKSGSLPEGVILDEDGDPVWVGDGAAPQGVRPGNREQRRAYAEAKEAGSNGQTAAAVPAPPEKTRRVAKKATKKKSKRSASANPG